jgi:hypothetical protein
MPVSGSSYLSSIKQRPATEAGIMRARFLQPARTHSTFHPPRAAGQASLHAAIKPSPCRLHMV